VLSEDRPTSGEPLKLNQVGIHHFAFWVDDLQETFDKVKAAGVPIVLQPTVFDTVAYGEPGGGKVMTTLFKDPDGTVIQLDQRV
jgi:catechol 2,3-dioxygenase-like lactoylglutathione lyase family enzyme